MGIGSFSHGSRFAAVMPKGLSRRGQVMRSAGYQTEPLEHRRLLAAVNWTGGGADNLWTNPANWSSNPALPGISDDVTISVATNPTITLNGGTQAINSLNSDENLTISGGTLSVVAASVVNGTFALSGGTLAGAGNVTLNGAVSSWTAGAMNGAGKTILAKSATLNISAASSKTLSRILECMGTTNVSHTSSAFTFVGGTFNNLAAGNLNFTGSLGFANVGIGNALNNFGTLAKLGGSTTVVIDIAVNNAGTIDVQNGVLMLSTPPLNFSLGRLVGGTWSVRSGAELRLADTSVSSNAATIIVAGTAGIYNVTSGPLQAVLANFTVNEPDGVVTLIGRNFNANPVGGTFTNLGALNLGPKCVFNVNGGFTQSGSINVEIAGPATGSGFGQIIASGNITLGGTLHANLINGYDPSFNVSFPVAVGSSQSGTFASVSGGPTPSNRLLIDRYNATSAYVAVRPLTGSAADLFGPSDSGVSANDDITNDDSPTFTGAATEGVTVRIYADGVLVGSGPITAGNWNVTTSQLSDGAFVITTTVVDGEGDASPVSEALTINVDTVGLVAPTSEFIFESALALEFVWEEDVIATLANSDLIVQNLAGGAVIGTALTYSNPMATFGFVGGTPPDGNYRAIIGAENVTDLAGNPMPTESLLDFFIFAADANRDRIVNISDFAILAGRFNQPGTFSQGDFNYDGVVNIADFSILASKFNQSLPAPADLTRGGDAGASTRGEAAAIKRPAAASVFAMRLLDEDAEAALI